MNNPVSDCKDDEFQCKDDKCISISEKCNGIKDCLDGDDEEHCGKFIFENKTFVEKNNKKRE